MCQFYSDSSRFFCNQLYTLNNELSIAKLALCWFPSLSLFTRHNHITKKQNYLTLKYAIHPEFTFRAAGRNLANYRSRNRPETHALPA
jgi:hypothetical protein